MKEKIEDIAKSIKQHRELEIQKSLSNSAIGRCNTFYNNEYSVFWITNKENISSRNTFDFNGNVTGRDIGNPTTLTTDGNTVYKNSKIGEILILNHEGRHNVSVPAGQFSIEIFNRSSFNPSLRGEYAKDILIKLAGDNKAHTFQNISKILSLQNEIDKDKEILGHNTDKDAELLRKRIADKEAEKKLYLDKAQGFIRKYAELRYQPILDPIQESIKRSNIFEGSLIINGGPGTGKTTSLIQRIKFLISHSIEEYIPLTQIQKDVLFNQKTSWVFYSPNELLALFLRNSMQKEELRADAERVKVWVLHKTELIKAYRLVDTATKRPFLFYNKSIGKSLFVNKSSNINEVVTELNKFFLDFQKDKLNKVTEIDVSTFKWKNTGLSIQKYINEKKNIKSIDDLIRLFVNLNETYKTESNAISEEYSLLIEEVAGRIQVAITKDLNRIASLSNILNYSENNNLEAEEDMDDDAEIEMEDFGEKNEQITFDFESVLFVKLKSLCRKQALLKFDKSIKFSKRERELLKLIPEIELQNEYEQIGQTAFFKKFFDRIIKGVIANVFREIPLTYKKFRREQLLSESKNWDLSILDDLVKKDNNFRIHLDEQALLLCFTNSVCYSLFKGFNSQFNILNHSYLTAYKNNYKPVIAIDEATDFSIIDLLAINSFRHPLLSSVTLSGDIMQRMTNDGLGSWEDFSNIVSGTKIKDLEVSYRQSPTLLSLAQSIYEKSTGRKAKYRSYIEKDSAEPKPLILVSEDEDKKLNWIADRIVEIYKAYNKSIPSIAIFLPKEDLIEEFTSKLANIDTLQDVGINVKACRNGDVLGEESMVRVFSIDKIKGLEFEAVFFHDLDELQAQYMNQDLLIKYLYVGISRATFYLAITLKKNLSEDLNFINDKFDNSSKAWH